MRTFLGLSLGILCPALEWASPLECAQESPNFGTVSKGHESTLRFACRNVGRSMLTMEAPGTSCSCLQAGISRERVAPGEAVEVTLRLSTATLSGHSQFYVAIPLHGGMEGAKVLVANADVRPQVIAIPEYVDLGNLQRPVSRQVLIIDTTGSPLELRRSRVRNGQVQVRLQPTQFLQREGRWQPVPSRGAVRGYMLEVQARPNAGERNLSDEVELEFGNTSQRVLRLRVTGYSQ
jgi:hypothetical protein